MPRGMREDPGALVFAEPKPLGEDLDRAVLGVAGMVAWRSS